MKVRVTASCDYSGYPIKGGSTLCTSYVAVYCESLCAFNMTLAMPQV